MPVVTKVNETLLMRSEAIFSECEQYRYVLRRTWGELSPKLNFLMLNPSTADEVKNDPTIARCEHRARSGGFGGYVITNLFAYRSTDPKAMIKLGKKGLDVIGPENDWFIDSEANKAFTVICAWGKDGDFQGRSASVLKLLRGVNLFALRVSEGSGQPFHPLYLSFDLKPTLWRRRV